jgi:endonuclease YncB( thermonuclease family)
MDRFTISFWALIAVLLTTSLFYGVRAEQMRRSLRPGGGKLDNGDIVKLVKVLDGDTVMVAKNNEEGVTVRLVGIKAFDTKVEKDVASAFGQASQEALQRSMADRPVRVVLGTTPKDRYGRYLATLYADDQDLALKLVKQGLVLVYTVYPFPAMQFYLQEQELARAGRRGIWASDEMTDRALALGREWQRQSQ